MAHHVFISYASKNKQLADALCHTLEQHRISCWIAPRDVLPGEPYAREIIRGIRNVRAEMNVPKNRKATAYVVCEDAQLCTGLEMLRQAARNMAAVNDLIIQHDTVGIPEDAVSIVVPDATVYLPLEELIDFDQELERLTKEEARLAKEIARAEGMLSNEKFVSKAPEAKVQEEREKLETYRQMMEQVQERLESLKAKRS